MASCDSRHLQAETTSLKSFVAAVAELKRLFENFGIAAEETNAKAPVHTDHEDGSGADAGVAGHVLRAVLAGCQRKKAPRL